MIAYLNGKLKLILENAIVIDVNGVGYQVHMTPSSVNNLPKLNEEVFVFTHHHMSENSQALYGFLSQEEVRLFTLLISVSGIGPKVASAVLGTLSPADLMMAIVADDAAAVSKAPGVGKKGAQRIILELRDKIKTINPHEGVNLNQTSQQSSTKQDAIDALVTLGYTRTEAAQSVLQHAADDMTTETLIRTALKTLGKKGSI